MSSPARRMQEWLNNNPARSSAGEVMDHTEPVVSEQNQVREDGSLSPDPADWGEPGWQWSKAERDRMDSPPTYYAGGPVQHPLDDEERLLNAQLAIQTLLAESKRLRQEIIGAWDAVTKLETLLDDDEPAPETIVQNLSRIGVGYRTRTVKGEKFLVIPLKKLVIAEGGTWIDSRPATPKGQPE